MKAAGEVGQPIPPPAQEGPQCCIASRRAEKWTVKTLDFENAFVVKTVFLLRLGKKSGQGLFLAQWPIGMAWLAARENLFYFS